MASRGSSGSGSGGISGVVLRIIGADLPGRVCPPGGDFPGYRNVHVAVQRKDTPSELLDIQPADAERVSWSLPCTASTTAAEGLVLNGPYIQNRLGGRFVYVSWVDLDARGVPTMFRSSVSGTLPTIRAMPKSTRCTDPYGPTTMFPGFTSRW